MWLLCSLWCLLGVPATGTALPAALWSQALPSSSCTPGGPWLRLCPLSWAWTAQPVLQPQRPLLSICCPCAKPLLGSRAARPHRPLLGYPGGFALNSHCSVPSPVPWRCAPLRVHWGGGVNPLPPAGSWPTGPRTLGNLLAEGYAGSGCTPTWDWGPPSKGGSIWGAFGPSVHIQHSGKVPNAEGREFWN